MIFGLISLQCSYMTVKGILECDKKPYTVYDFNTLKDEPLIELDTIGLKGSPTNVYKSFSPPVKGAGQMVAADQASIHALFKGLADKHII